MTSQRDSTQSFSDRLSKLLYDELELRVGMKLSEGMSDDQMLEFEAIVSKDTPRLSAWLRQHSPDFDSDPKFQALEERSPGVDALDLVADYAATKWLAINRPDYETSVRAVRTELALTTRSCADRILGTDSAG
ncbi:hypothetical protein SAMN06295909_0736 [Plantibacter sp. VKM Ac-1784]|uniref:Uncharacterized protein n=1 Tax=Plantibacter elymi (nom. nud.) TaxID=199708 RepID=A0ABY1R8Y6_9MICO|nr:hypothetical protein SAMN06295909_0736 [Plantibacter sp. VKM Ac-1784]